MQFSIEAELLNLPVAVAAEQELIKPWYCPAARASERIAGSNQFLFSGDGNGKMYKFSLDGKLQGWAQTSLGHGQNGCLVHELHCESETVLYKGDCSTWTVRGSPSGSNRAGISVARSCPRTAHRVRSRKLRLVTADGCVPGSHVARRPDRQTAKTATAATASSSCRSVDAFSGSSATFSSKRVLVHPPWL